MEVGKGASTRELDGYSRSNGLCLSSAVADARSRPSAELLSGSASSDFFAGQGCLCPSYFLCARSVLTSQGWVSSRTIELLLAASIIGAQATSRWGGEWRATVVTARERGGEWVFLFVVVVSGAFVLLRSGGVSVWCVVCRRIGWVSFLGFVTAGAWIVDGCPTGLASGR